MITRATIPTIEVLVKSIRICVWIHFEQVCEVFTDIIELVVIPDILIQSIIQTTVNQHLKAVPFNHRTNRVGRVRERIRLTLLHRRSHVASQRALWVSGTKPRISGAGPPLARI
jgi:hypothetical protein